MKKLFNLGLWLLALQVWIHAIENMYHGWHVNTDLRGQIGFCQCVCAGYIIENWRYKTKKSP